MNDRRERLLADLESALERLSEALAAPKTDLNRDASIQRFEFTFELFWKSLKFTSRSPVKSPSAQPNGLPCQWSRRTWKSVKSVNRSRLASP